MTTTTIDAKTKERAQLVTDFRLATSIRQRIVIKRHAVAMEHQDLADYFLTQLVESNEEKP